MVEFDDTIPETDVDDYDFVNHPAHYNGHPKGIECIDVIEEMRSSNLSSVFRYIWRVEWGNKPDQPKLRDLEKAKWYLDREVERTRKAEEVND